MRLRSIDTEFGVCSSCHICAQARQSQGAVSTKGPNLTIFVLAKIEILLCKGPIVITLSLTDLKSDQK